MTSIFFENMECKVNGEKVTNLLLKTSPHLTLHIGKSQQLLTVKHSYVGYCPHKSIIISILLTFLRHSNPSLRLCLFLSPQPEAFPIRSQVNYGVCYDMLTVLHMSGGTNSSSSAQSKCRWWRTPLGRVFSRGYSLLLRINSRWVKVCSACQGRYCGRNSQAPQHESFLPAWRNVPRPIRQARWTSNFLLRCKCLNPWQIKYNYAPIFILMLFW